MTDDTKTYNGWTNYETWSVKLWMDNEEGDYRYWLERVAEIKSENTETVFGSCEDDDENEVLDHNAARYALTTSLQDWVEENNPLADQVSMYSDILGAAISEVNWYEIAESMLEHD